MYIEAYLNSVDNHRLFTDIALPFFIYCTNSLEKNTYDHSVKSKLMMHYSRLSRTKLSTLCVT